MKTKFKKGNDAPITVHISAIDVCIDEELNEEQLEKFIKLFDSFLSILRMTSKGHIKTNDCSISINAIKHSYLMIDEAMNFKED